MVEGRDYRFTTFQARESSLVEERAAFFVKMQQEGVSEHSSHFACTPNCPAKHLTPVLTGDKIRSCFRKPHHVVLAQYRNRSGQARLSIIFGTFGNDYSDDDAIDPTNANGCRNGRD